MRYSNNDDSDLDQMGAEEEAPTVGEGSVEEFKLNIININKKFFNPNLDFNSKLKVIMELAKKSNSIDEQRSYQVVNIDNKEYMMSVEKNNNKRIEHMLEFVVKIVAVSKAVEASKKKYTVSLIFNLSDKATISDHEQIR
jgi:hypothetical protein